MNDSDVGYSFEWEVEFLEWQKSKNTNVVDSTTQNSTVENYPEIKKQFSENFILNTFFDQNNDI